MIKSRLIESDLRASFSGIGADTREIPLPPGVYDKIFVHVLYNVTDAGISTGENFAGLIDRLTIGEGQNTPIDVRTDEISQLVQFMSKGPITGVYQDSVPTTATDQDVYITLTGPFNLAGMKNPLFTLALRAIQDEFGAASAFTATIEVGLLASKDQSGYGVYYHREYRATSTRHVLNLGPSLVKDIYFSGTATAKCGNVSIVNAGPTYEAQRIDYPYLLNQIYCDWAECTMADGAGAFLMEGVNIPWSTARQLVIENSSTDTCLMFARNVVSK
jgi:hypothetical protein